MEKNNTIQMSLSKEKSIISDRKATTNSGDTLLISTFWPGLRLCLWLETASHHGFIVTEQSVHSTMPKLIVGTRGNIPMKPRRTIWNGKVSMMNMIFSCLKWGY